KMAAAAARDKEDNEDITSQETASDRNESLSKIFQSIKENVQEPSTNFIRNINFIYTFPEQDFLARLSSLPIKQLQTFREQMFIIFVDHFKHDNNKLSQHGFNIPGDKKNIRNLLKVRRTPQLAAQDIYDMGLSVHESKICTHLAQRI
uniref:Uncharacterized protein n=1 Tax=Clytia hemisphaerica TaxID=252671 RepID=A0A7M5XL82_9CNID